MAFNLSGAWKALTSPTQRTGYGITASQMSIPPGWNTQQYLNAYGQVGWLFGAVSLIATSVAEVEWHLDKGDKEQPDNHPLLTLFNKPNPFQTRYEMFLMLQTYLCLVGKAFIILNYKGRYPVEMWLAPPQFMTIIPDKQKYIGGYSLQAGNEKIFFNPDEVIYINWPNPICPMDGMGAVQSISTDLQNEIYATRYTNKLFFNDAVPGFAIEIPEMYTKEQRETYQVEWDERHRGWANARKTAFLWGGAKINTLTMTNKDMDFAELRSKDKEVILGTLHVPARLLGLTDAGTRAAIEADDYVFAKRVVKPACQLLKEAFNEQLCPIFGTDLNTDFDNPIPANKEVEDNSTRASFLAGLITHEEARFELGYEPEPVKGETLYIPFNLTPQVVGLPPTPTAPPTQTPPEKPPDDGIPEEMSFKGYNPDRKQRILSIIDKTATALEGPFKRGLRSYWEDEQAKCIANLKSKKTPDVVPDNLEYRDLFVKNLKPAIHLSVQTGWNNALDEIGKGKQATVTKQSFDLLNERALRWIASRSLSLAKMVNGTTKDQLRAILAAEFEAGSSIDTMVSKIIGYYKDGFENRATLVARTETITASNKGSEELYKSEGVKQVIWLTAQSGNTCPECEELDNQVFDIDKGPRPSLHPQCLLPDNLVEGANLIAATQARYEGQAVEITLRSGRRLAVTKNHPVLTPDGFILAKHLRTGGYVTSCIDSQRVAFSLNPDDYQMPAMIQDIWQAFSQKAGVVCCAMPVSPEDFHGDAGGFYGDVNIKYTNRLLLSNLETVISQVSGQDSFSRRNIGQLPLNGSGALSPLSESSFSVSGSDMRGFGQGATFIESHPLHSENVGLTAVAGFDSGLYNSPADNTSIYPELSRKFQFRFSGLITPDEIINIRNYKFSGHVYDLQSLDRLYIVNGVVVKNCRCAIAANI